MRRFFYDLNFKNIIIVTLLFIVTLLCYASLISGMEFDKTLKRAALYFTKCELCLRTHS